MNKIHLTVGGAAAGALAVGAAAGYFFAKKHFDAILDKEIAEQVEATKKHYSIILMNQQYGKPDSPADIEHVEEAAPEPAVEPENDPDVEVYRAGLRERTKRPQPVRTDYQSFAQKPDLSEVASNVFTNPPSSKRPMPPRDDHGKFLPKGAVLAKPEPFLIAEDEFLANDPEYNQESLLYFDKDNTLLMVADNEPVDVGRIGEENLEEFPQHPPRVIYVRNDGLQLDYQITLTSESLTEYMGLGEEDPDPDEEDDEDENPNYQHSERSARSQN